MCLYLFLIISFKGDVDLDYVSYKILLENAPKISDGLNGIHSYSNEYSFEIGLTLLNIFLNTFNVGLYGFYGFIAFFSIYAIYNISVIRNQSNCLFVFCLLYVFSFIGLWVQVRYGLACLISLLAIIYFFEGKVKKSIFLILFSMMFHKITLSLFIPFFLYFLFNKIGFKKKYILFLLVIFSGLLYVDFSIFLKMILIFFNDRYDVYSSEDAGSKLSYFTRLIFLFIMLMLVKKNISDIKNIDKFLVSMVVSSVLIFVFATQITILYRLGVFFELGYIFFLKRTLYGSKFNYNAGVFVIFLMLFYRFLKFEGEVLPYYSILLR